MVGVWVGVLTWGGCAPGAPNVETDVSALDVTADDTAFGADVGSPVPDPGTSVPEVASPPGDTVAVGADTTPNSTALDASDAETPENPDRDHDGLLDVAETVLAARVAPTLWFAAGEKHAERAEHFAVTPVTLKDGTVGVRVLIAFGFLRDGGDPDLAGASGHLGDAELAVFDWRTSVAIDSVKSAQTAVLTLELGYLSQHFGTATDTSGWAPAMTFDVIDLGDGNPHPVLYLAHGKHAVYASLGACDLGGLAGSDDCGEGFSATVLTLPERNLGSRAHPLADETVGLGGLTDGVDWFWSGPRFCGWQVRRAGHRLACVGEASDYSVTLPAFID